MEYRLDRQSNADKEVDQSLHVFLDQLKYFVILAHETTRLHVFYVTMKKQFHNVFLQRAEIIF